MQVQDYADLYALEKDFWWFAGMREITAALLDVERLPTRDRLVLDAGCGTGGNLEWLARYTGDGRTVGIDLSIDALSFSAQRRQKLARASVTELPFADSSFDLVTSFDVLVQLPGDGADEQAMREMHRVLRAGGIAFVRVAAYPWMRSDHDNALGTQRRYLLGELTGKIKSAGFVVLRATYANSFLLPLAVVRRLLLKRIGIVSRGSDVQPLPPGKQWVNRALAAVLRGEASILRAPRARLPFGLSAIVIARK